ncbi:hypothetical protein M4951_18410 [Blastopirellula sp. J2-11]|uniref:hypothetical protein n=1 Tax=Blastopirellula sp. J2-11 TaxID=2943192 RepID=UPI0021C5E41D|nr:hypothetical protein [Blastopirellula sp. J2-11]UUO05342.1 hypothetical protein M4951_18410 [Blastopirellula sp. J2-11]
MRNIFDQYEQPENRLTHALVTTLDQDRSMLAPFLQWIGVDDVPKPGALLLSQQQVPGTILDVADELDQKGLPDAAVFDEAGWAVLFECKVQAKTSFGQLQRHRATAKRNGFEAPWVVVISVDDVSQTLPEKTLHKAWRDLYAWFNGRAASSFWARQFVDYMQTFERKMLARDYQIRGTITVFDGLRFDNDNPYTYREAKRLLRLLGDLVQARRDLHKIGVDPTGKRRPAITGKGTDAVWDFLPLNMARDAKQFTDFPHLTIGINRKHAVAAITVPNGVKGGFRSKLSAIGFDGFLELIDKLEQGIRPIIERSEGAKPMIYVTQRHYRSQRSIAEIDARLDADLRTAFRGNQSGVKYQPQWVEAIYQLLINKRSNIQLGVDVQFSYSCPIVRSAKAVSLFADTWKAISPLINFVLVN